MVPMVQRRSMIFSGMMTDINLKRETIQATNLYSNDGRLAGVREKGHLNRLTTSRSHFNCKENKTYLYCVGQ